MPDFYDPFSGGGYNPPPINWGDFLEPIFRPAPRRPARGRVTSANTLEAMAAEYRRWLAEQAAIQAAASSARGLIYYGSFEPRQMPWARSIQGGAYMLGRQAVGALFGFLIGKARKIPPPPKPGRSSGPGKRYARGKKPANPWDQAVDDAMRKGARKQQMVGTARALGSRVPDWLKIALAWVLGQAGLDAWQRSGQVEETRQKSPEELLEDSRRRRREDTAEDRANVIWQQAQDDRNEAKAERKAKAEKEAAEQMGAREQARRDAEAAAKAAAEAARQAAPKPFWQQVLLGGVEYAQARRLEKSQRSVTSFDFGEFPDFGPAPGLTPFESGGVGFRQAMADCECPPKQKRKRKARKDRTVCYTGRFIERSRGQSKYSKRKVPCRPSRKKLRS